MKWQRRDGFWLAQELGQYTITIGRLWIAVVLPGYDSIFISVYDTPEVMKRDLEEALL